MRVLKRLTANIYWGLSAILLIFSSLLNANPVIKWEPAHIEESVVVGTNSSATVIFTVSETVAGAIDVRVAPKLSRFISVKPSSFETPNIGDILEIELGFLAPIDTEPGSYEGTIHLNNSNRTLAKPLPVVLTISGITDGLPPDPGDAGMATLEGIDSDNDGLRDDVQRYIALTYRESENLRNTLIQYTKGYQRALIDADSKELSLTNT